MPDQAQTSELTARVRRVRLLKWEPGFLPTPADISRAVGHPECLEVTVIGDDGSETIVYSRREYE